MWFIQKDKDIVVIDPGEASTIIAYLRDKKLSLKAILLTHDHWDHVNGLQELLKYTKVPVYGKCPIANHQEETFLLFDRFTCQVLFTPGHTDKSVCYLIEAEGKHHLFCGDTLFAAGCGRVFTGDFEAMFNSLNQLKQLSSDCLVYPGHEYTLKNLKFAQFMEPQNKYISQRIETESNKWEQHHNTLPVFMEDELKTNPFFRCEETPLVHSVSEKIGRKVEAGLDCFIQLRKLKDNF